MGWGRLCVASSTRIPWRVEHWSRRVRRKSSEAKAIVIPDGDRAFRGTLRQQIFSHRRADHGDAVKGKIVGDHPAPAIRAEFDRLHNPPSPSTAAHCVMCKPAGLHYNHHRHPVIAENSAVATVMVGCLYNGEEESANMGGQMSQSL